MWWRSSSSHLLRSSASHLDCSSCCHSSHLGNDLFPTHSRVTLLSRRNIKGTRKSPTTELPGQSFLSSCSASAISLYSAHSASMHLDSSISPYHGWFWSQALTGFSNSYPQIKACHRLGHNLTNSCSPPSEPSNP